MLTNEKVLEVFSNYLSQDPDYEVVMTSHGYTLMYWNEPGQEWNDAQYCGTPEDLRDALSSAYKAYLEYVAAGPEGDPTEQQKKDAQAKLDVLLENL